MIRRGKKQYIYKMVNTFSVLQPHAEWHLYLCTCIFVTMIFNSLHYSILTGGSGVNLIPQYHTLTYHINDTISGYCLTLIKTSTYVPSVTCRTNSGRLVMRCTWTRWMSVVSMAHRSILCSSDCFHSRGRYWTRQPTYGRIWSRSKK